jgi:hypothetical protein
MSIVTLGRYLEADLRSRIAFDVADFHVGDVLQVNLVDVEHLRTRYRRPRPSPLKTPKTQVEHRASQVNILGKGASL